MKMLKKIVFWILYLPLCATLIVANAIESICSWYDDCLEAYEGWTFKD